MPLPPFNELRLKPGEKPKPERLEELFEGSMRNFEDLYHRFSTALNIEELRKRIAREFVDVLGAATGVRVSFGIVSAEGTRVAGTGFACSKSATGTYTVAFEKAFESLPAVIGCDAQGTQRTFSVTVPAKNAATVIMSSGTGAKENIQFAFVAIG